MTDYMELKKVRVEEDTIELKVTAACASITANAKIYVTGAMLEELREQICLYLEETDLEGYWENDVPGIGGPPCVTMKFLPRDSQGKVLSEIYMELNDGGPFLSHNCRFYVRTDVRQLRQFADGLVSFLHSQPGTALILNPEV